MSKYRKKSVIVEVEKVADLIFNASHNWDALPDWIISHYEKGDIIFADNYISIRTDEGIMSANRADFIICGVKGEIYPCKCDVFEMTYEKEK